jgi:cell division protein FtsL
MKRTSSYRHNVSSRHNAEYRRNVQEGRYQRSAMTLERGTHQVYVQGNTARKLQELPVERPETRRHHQSSKSYQQTPVKMPYMNAASFLFITIAALFVLGFGFSYLQTQAKVSHMKSEVVTLQTEVNTQKMENTQLQRNLDANVDLSEIYSIATGKLGMKAAVDHQIYHYTGKKSNMVKQYKDIPLSNK